MLFPGASPSASLGCPACSGDTTVLQFDWKAALQDPSSDWAPSRDSVKLLQKTDRGAFYQCSRCRQLWYLGIDGQRMRRVPAPQAERLRDWATQEQTLRPDLFLKAQAIGAIPAHRLARQKDYAELPARVKTQEGRWFEKALLVFSAQPPLPPELGEARLVTEITELEPSVNALPASIRRATTLSQPNEQGQALTRVCTPQGKEFDLNWAVNFFDRKGCLGSQLRRVEGHPDLGKRKKQGKLAVLSEPSSVIQIFVGHWSPKIKELWIR